MLWFFQMKREKQFLESCVVSNTIGDDGNAIQMKLSIYSWVTMQPSLRGNHHVKKEKSHDMNYHLKVRIVEFKWDKWQILEVYIQHVYKANELSLVLEDN